MEDVTDRIQEALDGHSYRPAMSAEWLVEALSRHGVVVLAKEDYDAMVIAARDRRDTDADELRPTLAPAEKCADCGAEIDPDDGRCSKWRDEP